MTINSALLLSILSRTFDMLDTQGNLTQYKSIFLDASQALVENLNKKETEEGRFAVLRCDLRQCHNESPDILGAQPVATFASRTTAIDMARDYNRAMIQASYPALPTQVFDVVNLESAGSLGLAPEDLKSSLIQAQEALLQSAELSDDPEGEGVSLYIDTALQQIDVALEKVGRKREHAN